MRNMVTMGLGFHVCPAWDEPAHVGLMNANAITGAFKAGWVVHVNSMIVNIFDGYDCTCARLQS